MLSLLAVVRADTPAVCFGDQVLGRWEVKMTALNREAENDQAFCNGTENKYSKTRHIILRSPNVAIDEDGSYGTWTFGYTNAINVRVGDFDYLWYFDYKEEQVNGKKLVTTNCTKSSEGMGWVHENGMTRAKYGCVVANNLQPTINETINYNGEPTPGPVNAERFVTVDGREYKLLPRKLKQRVPYGPALQRLAPEKKLLSSVPYSGDKLPEQFDWRNVDGKSYVPPPFDQLKCGSCYVCATSYMMMSRIMVQRNTPGDYPKLSVQHAVDCSVYSQGCSGGFGEHVGRFAENFGIMTETDYGTYIGLNSSCTANKTKNAQRYYFQATQALGGYLGAVTDPVEMQWELYRNGPIAVSVQVDDFFYAFDPYGFDNSINQTDSDDPSRHYFYDEVNHLVLLVGWTTEDVTHNGETKKEKLWIIQNSWGNWGPAKDGSMKIVMGQNAYGIESQPITTFWRKEGAAKYSDVKTDWIIGLSVTSGVFFLVAVTLATLYCLQKKNKGYTAVEE